ncbi:MAG TPA: hypothetical protein VF193_02575 [Steroidobacter sp.]
MLLIALALGVTGATHAAAVPADASSQRPAHAALSPSFEGTPVFAHSLSPSTLDAQLASTTTSQPPGKRGIRLAALDHRSSSMPRSGPSRATFEVQQQPRARPEERDSLQVWLMAIIAVALVGYQLHRKHRLLRPQRFTL